MKFENKEMEIPVITAVITAVTKVIAAVITGLTALRKSYIKIQTVITELQKLANSYNRSSRLRKSYNCSSTVITFVITALSALGPL